MPSCLTEVSHFGKNVLFVTLQWFYGCFYSTNRTGDTIEDEGKMWPASRLLRKFLLARFDVEQQQEFSSPERGPRRTGLPPKNKLLLELIQTTPGVLASARAGWHAERDSLSIRLYFPGFPIPAFPGFPAFLKFLFPGKNGRESGKSNMALFFF
jgi:hypothetical protein